MMAGEQKEKNPEKQEGTERKPEIKQNRIKSRGNYHASQQPLARKNLKSNNHNV